MAQITYRRSPRYRLFRGVSSLAIVAGLMGIVACSSSDLTDMEVEYPLLVDIPPAPEKAETSAEKADTVQALRDEAEARKDEGFQPPQ